MRRATREFALLEPDRVVAQVDAVVFTGGSAFGLATADGVMRYLAEQGRGFPTAGGPVPIVPDRRDLRPRRVGRRRPGRRRGLRGRVDGRSEDAPFDAGRVGAGTGATIGKWRGREHAVAGRRSVSRTRGSTTRPSSRSRSSTRSATSIADDGHDRSRARPRRRSMPGLPDRRVRSRRARTRRWSSSSPTAVLDKLACHLAGAERARRPRARCALRTPASTATSRSPRDRRRRRGPRPPASRRLRRRRRRDPSCGLVHVAVSAHAVSGEFPQRRAIPRRGVSQ